MTPRGFEVTVPVPTVMTVRVKSGVKVAVQVMSAAIVTEPSVQSVGPLQPVKVDPVVGVAVRVTTLPLLKEARQVASQVIPVGLLVTVPLPSPARVTVRVNSIKSKMALQLVNKVMVSVIGLAVPVQLPPHLAKVESPEAVAVRVTTVPSSKLA